MQWCIHREDSVLQNHSYYIHYHYHFGRMILQYRNNLVHHHHRHHYYHYYSVSKKLYQVVPKVCATHILLNYRITIIIFIECIHPH